jgi:flagellar hook assembly protein FlgD
MKLTALLILGILTLFFVSAFATNPTAVITSPTANQILSNVTNSGSMTFAITGTASDPDGDFQTWRLDYGLGSNPTTWPYSIASGTSQVINATFTQWQTQNITNQTVQIRLRVTDVPQHITDAFVVVTIGNFKMSQNAEQFNNTTSGTITYTSTIPAQFTAQNPLIQTITLKNVAGIVARTLVSSLPRAGGTYNDTWDGKNDSAIVVPEGGYLYTSYVVNGSSSMTWDVSNQFVDTHEYPIAVNGPPTCDAYDNNPFNYNFTIDYPARITLMWTTYNYIGQQNNCNYLTWYCEYIDRYAASGTYYGTWAGVDGNDILHPELVFGHVVEDRRNFQKNAVVVFGNKPNLTNLAFNPSIYNPITGQNQTISFNLATYQSQNVPTVNVSIKNISTASLVRTLIVNNVAPGVVSITWDGKASNGKYLSPDSYLVTVTLTDAIGNQLKSQAFTTVRY